MCFFSGKKNEEDSEDSITAGQYGKEYSGDATYYGFTTAGNCAFFDNVPQQYDGMIPGEATLAILSGCLLSLVRAKVRSMTSVSAVGYRPKDGFFSSMLLCPRLEKLLRPVFHGVVAPPRLTSPPRAAPFPMNQ